MYQPIVLIAMVCYTGFGADTAFWIMWLPAISLKKEGLTMAKILTVDDAAFMRRIIKTTLRRAGYTEIYEAADGVQAIEKYNQLKPNLVLMDITMPNMNGLNALKAIRAADPNANVVMCTAMGQENMVIEAIRSGAKDFIVKPFKPERILSVVAAIIGNP